MKVKSGQVVLLQMTVRHCASYLIQVLNICLKQTKQLKEVKKMPKIIPKPQDEYKRKLICKIEYEYNVRGITREKQEVLLHLKPGSYLVRRKDPGKFTLDELLCIATKLKIPLSELLTV